MVLLGIAAVVGGLVALDLGLRWAGLVPPDDPLLFFTRTHAEAIDPFVRAPDGRLEIRPDWVNDGQGLRGRQGRRAGRQFLLPGFRPARLLQPKPAGQLRIVALGGSTTYGLYVGAGAAFPAVLGELLAARVERPVEVVNLGCPGFASDRVAALLPAVIGLDPDLVVILTGHNEMLAGDVGELSPALALRAALLSRSTLFAWWNHALAGLLRSREAEAVREEVAATRAGEIPTFVPEAVPAGERRARSAAYRQASADRYADNLGRIAEGLRAARVPFLFALPVANLLTPPLAVDPQDPEAARALREALRAADALREGGHDARAQQRLRDASERFPESARVHYAYGRVLLALGRERAARAALWRAVDTDLRTHRIDSAHEAALRRLVQRLGLPWVDLRPVLQSDLAEADATLFVDHVHPTAAGHARIAEALLSEVLHQLQPASAVRGGSAGLRAGRSVPVLLPLMSGTARRRRSRVGA